LFELMRFYQKFNLFCFASIIIKIQIRKNN
jgi:hypothetical protein